METNLVEASNVIMNTAELWSMAKGLILAIVGLALAFALMRGIMRGGRDV